MLTSRRRDPYRGGGCAVPRRGRQARSLRQLAGSPTLASAFADRLVDVADALDVYLTFEAVYRSRSPQVRGTAAPRRRHALASRPGPEVAVLRHLGPHSGPPTTSHATPLDVSGPVRPPASTARSSRPKGTSGSEPEINLVIFQLSTRPDRARTGPKLR